MTAETQIAAAGDKAVLRRARLSVSAIFLVHGLVVATWVSRIPVIQMQLRLSTAELGFALLGIAGGCCLSMPAAGLLLARTGSRKVTMVSSLLFCAALALPGLAWGRGSLLILLALFGAAGGAMDVAMNAHAALLEEKWGSPVMSSFHALFSAGGMCGAALGGVAAAHGVPPLWHFAGAGILFSVLVLWAAPGMLPSWADSGLRRSRPRRLTLTRTLAALGFLAAALFLGEGAMADWSALFLRGAFHTGPGTAAAGYAVFSAFMALGRVSGDWLTQRIGRAPLARAGLLTAAAGLTLALLAPSLVISLAGFALTGAGFSTVVPLTFAAAGRSRELPPGAGIAAVTTAGYAGLFAGPPVIGMLAAAISLRGALFLVVGLAAAASMLAGAVDAARGERLQNA